MAETLNITLIHRFDSPLNFSSKIRPFFNLSLIKMSLM